MLAASATPLETGLSGGRASLTDGDRADSKDPLCGLPSTPISTATTATSGTTATTEKLPLPPPSLPPASPTQGGPVSPLQSPPTGPLPLPLNGHESLEGRATTVHAAPTDAEQTNLAPPADGDTVSGGPVHPAPFQRSVSARGQPRPGQETTTAALLPCPLCQGERQGLDDLQDHLRLGHKVTAQAMKKLLSMVDIPGEAPPASAQTGREDTAVAEDSREDRAESADGREGTAACEDSGGGEMGAVEDSCGKPEAPEGGHECAGASAVAGETPGRVDIGAGDTGLCGGPRTSESKNSSPSATEVLGTLEMDLERLEEAHSQLVKEHGVTDMDDTAEEEEVYRCQLCALDFHSIDKMYGHQKELGHLELKQTPRGPGYLCWKKGCNQYFKTIEVLQTHFREIHVRKPALTETSKCQHCLLEFTDKASLEFHSLYHKVKSVVQCSVCQKSFPTVQLLKSHLQHEHADLGEKELEGLLKNVDDILMSVVRVPSYEQFFTDYLGCKLCDLWDSTDAAHTSTDEEMTCVDEHTSPVPKASVQKQTIAPNACINQKSKGPISKINKAQTTLLGKGNAEVCINSSLDQANVLQGKQKKKPAPSKEQDQQKSLSDFQSLEDSLNKESVALEKYKDPTRKFKCHECKMGFTKKHYLVVHNRLTKHIPDSVLAYYARERYEDPNRPYKCELCKTSFMQKNGLLVHFNSVCHLRKANEAAIIGAEPVVSDAPTTHTTDSLSQNNSAEPESSVSVPTNNNNTTSKIVTHSACSTETFQPVLSSDLERAPCSVQRVPNPHEDKTPHHCDICDVSFGQKSHLETHFRSVAHQKRVVQLYEQNVNGQVSMEQQMCHPPQGAVSTAQMQQMQAMLEMMQQQQLSALSSQPVMMEVQTIPAFKSVPVSEQRSGTFSASTTSSTSTSHFTSAPRLTIATATAMDTEPASYASTQQQTEDRTSEKKSKDLKELFADSKNKLTEIAAPNCVSVKIKTGDAGFASVDQEKKSEHCVDSKPKIQEMTAASPNCAYVKRETVDDVDSVSTGISTDTTTYQAVLKSEMSTNTTDSPLPSVTKSSDFPSNPVLAASIPLNITQPRGFMGRFKPHLQRNLLENFGFECVMQYNENTQSKRKERWKDKETKKSDCQAESTNNLNTASESSTSCENVDKEDTSVKVETDLPEINKSRCLECGHQFSSIFVLKTHEEEVHKKIVPTDIVEDLGEKFRIILEKRQPKTETLTFVPAQSASVTAVSVTSPLTVTTSLSATTCSSTITTLASDKSSTKSSKEDMPPPPAPLRQLPPPYDMSQAMSMLGMVSMPMNLMSLGMQSSLTPVLPSGSVDHTSTFPVNLGMIDAGLSTHQTLQQSSTLTQNQKRARTRINDDQLSILRAHFDINNSPTETQISQMAEMCGLPQKVIKHWFRNTLFKERQKNKDSPYNFNNPPSTTIDLEEYEKTGKLQATVVKMEVCEEDSYIPNSREENTDESYLKAETLLPPHPLEEFMPKQDPEDRRENEHQPDAFTPACFSSARTTHTPSAPSNSGSLPCSATSILDAQAIVLAREAAAAAQNAATKRANRTRFTDYQVKILHEYFEQNAYPKDDELDHLSKILSLNPRVIVVWFQNARQKARKVYENQPPLESKDSSNGIPFQRTSSLSNHCKKCGAVFQRYFELIKHQKQSCFSENNNNKPFLAYADDDSFSSCTSLEDSGLLDSLNLSANNSQKDRTSPSAVSKPFSCDKCDMSFTQAEHLHNHQKVHSLNTNVDQSLSTTSAFGMLQTLAKQEDQTAGETAPPMTSSPTTSTATSACSTPQSLTTLDSNKHKLEPVDHEMGDDQPKDKRLRTTILPEQLDYLYQKYQQDCNPSRKQLELISEEVGLKKRVVQVWFQNTRARERKGQPRTHQQLINKRCPFCNAIFRARSALESHLVNKHPTEMAKGEINIDAIPDVTMVESPQPAHSVPSVSTSHQSASAATDISKMFAQSGIPPYFSFMPASSLALGFPPGLSPSDSVQLSMQHLYEDAYKKYITELSGTTLSPVPLIKTSHVPETLISTSVGQNQPVEKQNTASSSVPVDSDAPLDLSMPVRNTKEPSKSNSLDRPITRDRSKLPASLHLLNDRHRSRSPQERTLPERTATQPSQSVRKQPSSSSTTNKSASHSSTDHSPNLSSKSSIPLKSQSGSHTPSSSFNEKAYLEFEHSRPFSQDNSFSETQSELSDGQSRGDVGNSPSGAGSGQKRHRTQMTSLQVKVMKLLFVDYKTPTMAECELLGHQIGLAKRVVQVWFQNARAKEKKFKQTMSKPPTDEFDYPKTAEECLLCHFKYSHKFTVQDHIFTQQHIDNIKEYVLSHADLERDMTDHALMSGSHRQPPQETEGKAWEKMRSSLSPQQMTQLQQGLNAAALGISTTLPGVTSPFSLGSLSSMPEGSASKEFQHKDSRPKKEKKNGNPAPGSGSKTGSSANSQRDKHHHQKQSQQQPPQQQHGQPVGQQATADLAQMMAFGGFLPGLDPSYLGYMYPGLPAFFPGLTPMPLLQPSFLPGAEYMFAHDQLSFGTPLPLLQIPPQAIKAISDKVQDSKCVRAHYTQDCKTLADLKGSVGSQDAACFVESFVDVGYICKKCQMVYPAREGCLAHQQMICYPGGEGGTKTMVKLEQLQYTCRKCTGEKFSTVSEVQSHCRKESHKAKVSKVNSSASSSASTSAPVQGSPRPAITTSAGCISHALSLPSQIMSKLPVSPHAPVQTSPKPSSSGSVHSKSSPVSSAQVVSGVLPTADDSISAPSRSEEPSKSSDPPQASQEPASPSLVQSAVSQISAKPDNASSPHCTSSASCLTPSVPVLGSNKELTTVPSPSPVDGSPGKSAESAVSPEADSCLDSKHPA